MMDISIFVVLGVIVVLVGYVILIYNNLVALKHAVTQAWSNIDVLLVQRHDELPKLIETCKQYMQHERQTLEKVMQARSAVSQARASGDVGAVGQAESALRLGLGDLFAVVEAYPDLKANERFRNLEARITELESSIADRREFYNAAVNQKNVRIEQFPDLIIARLLGFRAARLLRFRDAQKADIDVKALFH